MAGHSLEDVLDIEYPGEPAWADDGSHVAATLYEDDGNVLVLATRNGEGTRISPGEGFVGNFTGGTRRMSRDLTPKRLTPLY